MRLRAWDLGSGVQRAFIYGGNYPPEISFARRIVIPVPKLRDL